MELKIGILGYEEMLVTENDSAKVVGSGDLMVFATPKMIALIEKTAAESVKPHLEEGTTSVGTKLDVDHVAATPIGMKVRCESELIEIDGRKLVFNVEAYDEAGLIGKGRHERFIVQSEKFMARTNAKLK